MYRRSSLTPESIVGSSAQAVPLQGGKPSSSGRRGRERLRKKLRWDEMCRVRTLLADVVRLTLREGQAVRCSPCTAVIPVRDEAGYLSIHHHQLGRPKITRSNNGVTSDVVPDSRYSPGSFVGLAERSPIHPRPDAQPAETKLLRVCNRWGVLYRYSFRYTGG